MIEVKFDELSIFVVATVLLFVGFLLFVHRSKERNYRRRRRFQIVKCPVCGDVFEDRTAEKIPSCKGCGRKTLRGSDRSLG